MFAPPGDAYLGKQSFSEMMADSRTQVQLVEAGNRFGESNEKSSFLEKAKAEAERGRAASAASTAAARSP